MFKLLCKSLYSIYFNLTYDMKKRRHLLVEIIFEVQNIKLQCPQRGAAKFSSNENRSPTRGGSDYMNFTEVWLEHFTFFILWDTVLIG